MVLESQDAIQSIEQIFREDAIRVEKMINLVEQDITEQSEDIMQIDQEEIPINEESKVEQFMINEGRTRERQIDRQDDSNDSQDDKQDTKNLKEPEPIDSGELKANPKPEPPLRRSSRIQARPARCKLKCCLGISSLVIVLSWPNQCMPR